MADGEIGQRKILDLRTVILGFGAWIGTVTAPVATDLLRQIVFDKIDQLPFYFGLVLGLGIAIFGYLLWRLRRLISSEVRSDARYPEEDSEQESDYDRYMRPDFDVEPPVHNAPGGASLSGIIPTSIRFLKLLVISIGFGIVMGITFLEIIAYIGFVTSPIVLSSFGILVVVFVIGYLYIQ